MFICIVLVLTGCTHHSSPDDSSHQLPFSRMVDLSHTITQDMPVMPGLPSPVLLRSPTDTTSVDAVHMSVYAGTHLALHSGRVHLLPSLFPTSGEDVGYNERIEWNVGKIDRNAQQPRTVDQMSPLELLVPVVVIDVRDAAQDTPAYRLSADDVLAWEQRNGRIPAGSMVLLATGWDIRWSIPAEYLNLDMKQVPQVPGFGADALALVLDERQAIGIGCDTPVCGSQAAMQPHMVLRNLTNVEQLPPAGVTLILGVLKIQASQASPARVVALVP